MANNLISPDQFTERELSVISLLLDGKSTIQIARQLEVSTRAIEHHLTHVYAKLKVCSRVEAVIKLLNSLEKPSGIRS
jgi:DNA-binding NarL/FixJ family response regulator